MNKPAELVAVDPGANAPIVFVGGTGRTGTHIASLVLGRSKAYRRVPVECRFHVDPDGFPALLDGRVSKEAFMRRMRGYWWKGFQTNRWRGMYRFLERNRYEFALRRFDSGFEVDAERACRQLFLDLLTPDEPGVGIIEQSCGVIGEGPVLARLFPEAKFVHVVRDGRDASASRVSQGYRWLVAPRTRYQGLTWWEQRMRFCGRGAAGLPEDSIHVIELESFFGAESVAHVRDLVGFLGDDANLRRVLKAARNEMNAERAHVERWRHGIGSRKQAEIERRYTGILERLVADEVNGADLLLAKLRQL